MVYYRTRDSRYAKYARAAGRNANFAIPTRRSANFSVLPQVLDAVTQYGSEIPGYAARAMSGAADLGGNAMNYIQDGAQAAGNAFNQMGGGIGQAFNNAREVVGGMNPMQQAGLAGAGAAATGGAAAITRGLMKGGQAAAGAVDRVADAAQAAGPGFRKRAMQRAGEMVRNPKALALGAGGAAALGGGAYAANRAMQPEEQY